VQRRDRCASSQDTGKRGEQFSEDAPCIGSILQIILDDSVLGYEQHPQQAHALPFLGVWYIIPQGDRCPIVGQS
jgi:hypothetical protein